MPIPFLFQQQTGLAKVLNGSQFYAPRTSSITQTRGSGTPTETRATTATVTNNDGYQVTALSGELRQQGSRRVYNQVSTTSDDFTNAAWTKINLVAAAPSVNATPVSPPEGTTGNAYAVTFPAVGAVGTGAKYSLLASPAFTCSTTRKHAPAIWIRNPSGASTIYLYFFVSGTVTFAQTTINCTTEWQRVQGVPTVANANGSAKMYLGCDNGITAMNGGIAAQTVEIAFADIYDLTAEADQTTIREHISVGVLSAPYHGAGVDGVKYFDTDISGNPIPAATLDGSVVEAATTNLCLQSNAFTTTWTAVGTPAVTQNVVGPDGATSAWTLTDNDGASVELIVQNIVLTAAAYTASIFVKKTVGAQSSYPLFSMQVATTGMAQVTIDTTNGIVTPWTAYTGFTGVGCTATCESFNANYWRVAVTFTGTAASWQATIIPAGTTNATQSNGVRDVAAQGSAVFYGAQVELGSYATSYIATTTAAVTRNKDVLDDAVSGNLTAAAGSVAFQFTPLHAPSGTIALCGSYVDASNYTALLHDGTDYIFRKRIGGVNYDATLTAAFAAGTTYDIALKWGASGSQIAVDGVLGIAHTNTTAAQLGTRWQWGADGNGGQQAGACFKEKFMWTRALSDSELQATTA